MTYKTRTAYISVSFGRRKFIDREIRTVIETLNCFNIRSFVFVDKYNFAPHEEKQMMQQAMRDIEQCDLLLAETSDKAIGIGVEVGYAKAKGKPVLYLRHQNAVHSTTVSGISDLNILYLDCDDLKQQLAGVLPQILETLQSGDAAIRTY